jgi:hypothetical protein
MPVPGLLGTPSPVVAQSLDEFFDEPDEVSGDDRQEESSGTDSDDATGTTDNDDTDSPPDTDSPAATDDSADAPARRGRGQAELQRRPPGAHAQFPARSRKVRVNTMFGTSWRLGFCTSIMVR